MKRRSPGSEARATSTTPIAAASVTDAAVKVVDIAPDVNCPHCGWVVICPHTPAVPYPPHCITPAPPQVEYERTGSFLENLRRFKEASQRAEAASA
jgi:hypothetical protein